MKTIARLTASAPASALEDALGLAVLCMMIAAGFSVTALL